MATSINEIAFQIILYGGNGRSSAMEAIQCAKERNFEEAEALIKEAEQEINKAHKYQTELLQNEAQGEESELNLLLIHSQDHLMNAITVKDLANEMVDLYKEMKS
ncbi:MULTISPECIES: PTS lactose/cellobiose transporter subunit IIA [Mammaliicoccus]|uniref:PTS lactose/cellobiose transporter subunit IIA n=1 Tax=Mammaliicoccus vitulinus TaxID=71237 RepID=A0A2T4PVJ0_9STAP|nr:MULTISPECIES: PTS lactose/cellobiose transporter subunit IIA [Mammaliicoccus]HAL08491.1 PTS lactose/cellobiose transporter subunit IIA [Staphylococcus sp.]MBM6630180.1 PTS lactose/cellobiose transporter subunit IIA [Mammaliicoccus vitulinus]MBO3078267.1 PTS lactose/cellobiose transporter subunit IIA [Mammaliicoccus vitulinus]MEB7658435.1 PTS lactose/cellobiose transporter subunit IIA [Mammaliicoccus vitulinus]PTI30458.1 PTS lactose/cellobiose transporter subunit IIA [Mammaliicoccus vitulinu